MSEGTSGTAISLDASAQAENALYRARAQGLFSTLDVEFALRLASIFEEEDAEVVWALAIACRQESEGHVCADLPALDARGLSAESEGGVRTGSALPEGRGLDEWLARLRASAVIASEPGSEASGETAPLVLDRADRLYLRRSFMDQAALARSLAQRAQSEDLAIDETLARAGVDRLLPPRAADASGPDWSRIALRTCLKRPLAVVTGGPGTGKTTLVVRFVALLVEQSLARGERAPRVRLLAPTGKAAAAMTTSFQRQRATLDVPEQVRAHLPTKSETIHRALLRTSRRDELGRRHVDPIDADVVVVDEASMVDLGQMRALLEASAGVARCVLLGDPDQLASVESGAVLAEICSAVAGQDAAASERPHAAPSKGPPASRGLADSIVTLRESHRFASGGAIGQLAQAIRAGDADRALALLDAPEHPEIERADVSSVTEVRERLVEAVREMQAAIEAGASPSEKLDRLASRRVLCAHRTGPLGVEALCEVLDDAAAAYRKTSNRLEWWRGKLLLVTRNAPEQDLWNGDVGLVEETASGLRAIFPDAEGGVRALSAGRVPSAASAIAMSVHKSQGSEYDVVDLVLGPRHSRLMTRELLYTGVTRARERLCIHASAEVIREALSQRVERDSGLADLLRESETA